MVGKSPTMTSGPGTKVGVSEPTPYRRAGMAIDLGSPLTSWSISIACIAAPIEIVPTAALTSAGRPSALANSFEMRSLPRVMVSN